jgi:predicted esterase
MLTADMWTHFRPLLIVGCLHFLGWSAVAGPPAATPAPAAGPNTADSNKAAEELAELVESYFKASSEGDRRKILDRISGAEGATLEAVAAAMRSASLWEPRTAGIEQLIPAGVGGPPIPEHIARASVFVPQGYDPARAYPLIFALHDHGGSGEKFVAEVRHLLGPRADEFIVAAPSDYRGVWLSSSMEAAAEPVRLMDALKRRYHIDSDRVYAYGRGLGGHAAIELAVLRTDWFASVVSVDGTLSLDMGAAGISLLLPNLRHTPLLAVYGVPEDGEADSPGVVVATWNRHIERVARERDLPVRTVELSVHGSTGVVPPPDVLAEWFGLTRPRRIVAFDHWFRYPSQGNVAWLRLSRLFGEPWTAERIVVTPGLGETREEAVEGVLREKLVYFGGEIDGQTVRVRSQGCERLELLLNEELIDMTKNVTIYLDGTARYEGPVRPELSIMLETALETWDFQRLWPVRFQLVRSGRAVQR